MVQRWFRDGSEMVQRWFRGGSRFKNVQGSRWFKSVPLEPRLNLEPFLNLSPVLNQF
jgi:hypothetical protein